ncbi:hypothetical protein N7481_004081 [Penicillium waksmanii]|uniref:uncharacterized protein n=1 Tax=Penicillium waksmanii TaxID=69791 RepID=UPI002548005D|nr:uncharacterized protein N7481_004081 [Penicillium waksmanii]KAJ5988871.1 hypothetical protein N7481_004081 [Penicillium waksmanii]
MDKAMDEKFNRLNLLLQGDEDLQHVNTQISTRMKARKKVSAPGLQDEETKVSTLEPILAGSQLSKGYVRKIPKGQNTRANQWIEWTQEEAIASSPDNSPSWCSAQGIFPKTIDLASSYCPVLALRNIPHKFFDDEARNKALAKFFETKTLFDRTWTLHYLSLPPGCRGKRLLLLVPLKEAYDYLQEVNTSLSCEVAITEDKGEGFFLQFDDSDFPRPTLLGVSSSLKTMEGLVIDKSRRITGSWADWMSSHQPAVLKDLEAKIGDALYAEKNLGRKGKKGKKKRLNVLEYARAGAECIDRLQQYFGLRPTGAGIGISISPVDVDSPAPWVYPDGPIFFSVDVEWKERNATHVTEIGISILDTQELRGHHPGLHGTKWMSKIRSHHLRVSEYRFHINKDFCSGCPNNFNYGKSHNTKQDLEQLASAGSESFRKILFNGPEAIFEETLDTASLYQGLRNDAQLTSLENMMAGLSTWTRDLHNGGNDARYTMVALIIIALEAAGEHKAAVAKESPPGSNI